ncbi:galactokinase [Nesterenkonia ebinurensis]|uniref:galactokinase n=1 Tax=Nesterenkonia ebinurensis TaxID=2608252 RepID=UPI00123DF8BE|nr:galactokinase family protein [Nesterenkonia ebinurensis]
MRENSARWLAAGDAESIAAALAARFAQVFEQEPAGVWFAPGRANLNGEHIDFHGGRCLPVALRHGTYVAAAARTDGVLRLRTLDPKLDEGLIEIDVAGLSRERTGADAGFSAPIQGSGARSFSDAAGSPALEGTPSWTAYVSGVLWALGQIGEEHPELTLEPGYGADLLIRSTLPIGAGLSSSASLECAAALAFAATGTPLGAENPKEELNEALTDALRAVLAQVCIRAEVEVVGAGTGGLDQNASLRAAKGKLMSLDCRDFSMTRTDLTFLLRDYQFLAIDTGQPHELADGKFRSRRVEAEAATAALGVERLRDALPAKPRKTDMELLLERFDQAVKNGTDFGGLEAEACRRRLKHALGEMLRSEKIHALVTAEAHGVSHTAQTLGDMLSAGHTSMREQAEVSFRLADQVVDAALQFGALGARLIGGGFGGSVLALVPRAQLDDLVGVCSRLSPEIRFLEVTPSAAARAV